MVKVIHQGHWQGDKMRLNAYKTRLYLRWLPLSVSSGGGYTSDILTHDPLGHTHHLDKPPPLPGPGASDTQLPFVEQNDWLTLVTQTLLKIHVKLYDVIDPARVRWVQTIYFVMVARNKSMGNGRGNAGFQV